MKPVVDRLSQEYKDKLDFFVYADLNSYPTGADFATQHSVSAVPTMVFVSKDGHELTRVVGAQPESTMRQLMDQAVAQK